MTSKMLHRRQLKKLEHRQYRQGSLRIRDSKKKGNSQVRKAVRTKVIIIQKLNLMLEKERLGLKEQ
ncbi:unnamed protein product [Paramecium sonneborni]|uniref:Uncharacterized protein n=1 Tax=Paramecium sonneborni TaxID=65129 RepID=A0A8S1RPG8_9CILI|nr:unnamed protein product [Paramecium sonneborni]